MIKYLINKLKQPLCMHIKLTIIFVFICSVAFAEGSKDLYLTGANTGYRSFLLSWPFSQAGAAFNPFPTPGRTWVYAKAGETIYMGSSVQGKNYGAGSSTGTIILRSPSGTEFTSGYSTTTGLIADKSQEQNGPNRTGVSNGYTPFTVLTNETGVWEVQFLSMGTGTTLTGFHYLPYINWLQPETSAASSLIAAWDVSVGNAATGALVAGRAYTTLLALCGPNGVFNEPSFYGKVYVLTPAGYVYEVDNNGQNGASFNFFSNNKGSRLPDGSPSYASSSYTSGTLSTMIAGFYDPRTPDNGTVDFTNKIFYNKPATDLPVSASVYFSNGTLATNTWLRPASVATPVFTSSGLTASCGGQFQFTPTASGTYRIALDVGNNGSFDDDIDVVLTGNAIGGKVNSVLWDGKNGKGVQTSPGATSVSAKISVSLPTSEVHFPFIDVEANTNGIKIQRLSADYNNYAGNTVYWNDAGLTGGVPPNPLINKSAGENSIVNGHIWSGTSASTQTLYFGNERMLDTWAYVSGDNQDFDALTVCRVISGNVWFDRDGLGDGMDNRYTETGVTKEDDWQKLPSSGLYATLVDRITGNVLLSVPVISGNYMFTNIANNASGYLVILTNQSYNTGDAQPSSALPAGDWVHVGAGRGTTSSATNGVITIGAVTTSTLSIANANFAIYSEQALPVDFGDLTAVIVNGELKVNWSTLTETNNSYFEIEVSKDGKAFVSIGKVNSKAKNGNSDTLLSYNYTTGESSATGLLGISVLSIALITLLKNRKNKWAYALAVVFGLAVFGASCTRQEFNETNNSRLFLRIKQIDKDGTFKYSKVFQAIIK